MKKIVLSLFFVIMCACAPAPATQHPTEVPGRVQESTRASEDLTPTPIPAPTERLQGEVYIKYAYLEGFDDIFTLPVTEKLSFVKNGGIWQKQQILSGLSSKYPLISFCISEKTIKGSLGINGHCDNHIVEIQPLEIRSETSVVYDVSVDGADYKNGIIISYLQSGGSQLNYKIDLMLHTFSYSYTGIWDFRWNEKIITTLKEFGYVDVGDNFKTEALPNGRYTIELIKK